MDLENVGDGGASASEWSIGFHGCLWGRHLDILFTFTLSAADTCGLLKKKKGNRDVIYVQSGCSESILPSSTRGNS